MPIAREGGGNPRDGEEGGKVKRLSMMVDRRWSSEIWPAAQLVRTGQF